MSYIDLPIIDTFYNIISKRHIHIIPNIRKLFEILIFTLKT